MRYLDVLASNVDTKHGRITSKKYREAQEIASSLYQYLTDAAKVVGVAPKTVYEMKYFYKLLAFHQHYFYELTENHEDELKSLAIQTFGFVPNTAGSPKGAFRICLVWNDTFVIKYARNSEAPIQNLVEAEEFMKHPELFPEVYYVDPFGRFSIIENLNPNIGEVAMTEFFQKHPVINSIFTASISAGFFWRLCEFIDCEETSNDPNCFKALCEHSDFKPFYEYMKTHEIEDLHMDNIAARGTQLVIVDLGIHDEYLHYLYEKYPNIKRFYKAWKQLSGFVEYDED